MKTNLALRPIHCACVSGGKDSLYMLGIILANPTKYPLDIVVHYDLEIDWDWAKRVIDEMERQCKNNGISFVRIKPRTSWQELYEKYGFPTHNKRWCNSKYKLDCATQLDKWLKSLNCRPIRYIGFCKDEAKRFKYDLGEWKAGEFCYPLAEEGINECEVLEWAKKHPLLKDWYNYFDRQGCMLCPHIKRREVAYMKANYNETYKKFISMIGDTEKKYHFYMYNNKPIEEFDKLIDKKYLGEFRKEF